MAMNKNKIKKNHRAAFTLVELVVVMGLTLLIGGMVTTFILFMNSYNVKNERLTQQAQDLSVLREETDKWFSYADGGEIDLSEVQNRIVQAGTMYISYESRENGCGFTFFYGEGDEKNRTCSFGSVYTLKIYSEESEGAESSSVLLRFTVRLRVSDKMYACEVYQ